MKRILAWFLNLISGGWFGPGTEDDFRNPFWRWTEIRAIKISESITKIDFRFGYFSKQNGKWVWISRRSMWPWIPGQDGNFYNGIFTLNITESAGLTKENKMVTRRRFNLVIRFFHSWWFAWGVGTLPDRGEFGWTGPWFFGFESQNRHNPGVIARDHEEGAV